MIAGHASAVDWQKFAAPWRHNAQHSARSLLHLARKFTSQGTAMTESAKTETSPKQRPLIAARERGGCGIDRPGEPRACTLLHPSPLQDLGQAATRSLPPSGPSTMIRPRRPTRPTASGCDSTTPVSSTHASEGAGKVYVP